MRDPDDFDAFYLGARERLLVQTYALTGDLSASRAAVRDAFVVAWHHWRKVGGLEDPEESLRPHAWGHARRRHNAHPWHRERPVDAETAATFEALESLPLLQRKALLLTELAAVPVRQMAREIGRPADDAEQELRAAVAAFASARDVPAPRVRAVLEELGPLTREVRWPRPSAIRRAGAARRRAHTTLGAAAVVVALVVSGSLVTDVDGVRPSLDRPTTVAAGSGDAVTPPDPEPTVPPLSDTDLLGTGDLARLTGRRGWKLTSTSDNSEGNGLVLPCQRERYADPRGAAALLREFTTVPRKSRATAEAFQYVEESRNPRAARRTFASALTWYAGCQVERAQLLGTRKLPGVGDRALLITLRIWGKAPRTPSRTIAVTLARTGVYTTTTAVVVENDAPVALRASARVAGAAVGNLCSLPNAGACATGTKLEKTAPRPVGSVPAMLSEIDLPPVATVSKPWVGTEPRKAKENLAATRCDQTDFEAKFAKTRVRRDLTRSFLIPQAKLPATFGLTQTVGVLPPPKARAFVEEVRSRLARCSNKDAGTEVRRIVDRERDQRSLTVWALTTEVSDRKSLEFSMAIVRHGGAISQLGFVRAGRATISDQDFVALAERAQDRLPRLVRSGQKG